MSGYETASRADLAVRGRSLSLMNGLLGIDSLPLLRTEIALQESGLSSAQVGRSAS